VGRNRLIATSAAVSATAFCLLGLLAACGDGGGRETGRSDRRACARASGWQPLRPALLRRTEVGAARIGRFIYVVGGFLPSRATTAAMERYDIRKDRWRHAPPLPIAVNHPAVTAAGGRLYVFGGYTDSSFGAVTGRLQRFDPRTGRWRLLPAAPTPRAAAGLGASGSRLYAVGGAAAGAALPVVEVYDVERRHWSSAPPLAVAREHLAVVAADGVIYAFGGRAGGENLRTVERYRPDADAWRRAPSLLVARSGFAAAAPGDRIAVFGGEELRPGGHTIRPVELLDGGTWRRLPGMRTPRHGLGGAAFDGRIYALEGGPEPGFSFSARLEVLDLAPSRTRRCGNA
jgi:N-acetylneuraminic acid mutarotase